MASPHDQQLPREIVAYTSIPETIGVSHYIYVSVLYWVKATGGGHPVGGHKAPFFHDRVAEQDNMAKLVSLHQPLTSYSAACTSAPS